MRYCSLLLEILEQWKLKVFFEALAYFKLCLFFSYKWKKTKPFEVLSLSLRLKITRLSPRLHSCISFAVLPGWNYEVDLFILCWFKMSCVNLWTRVNWSVKKGQTTSWNRLLIRKLKQTRKNFAVRVLYRGFWVIVPLYSEIFEMFMTLESWLLKEHRDQQLFPLSNAYLICFCGLLVLLQCSV